MVMMIGIIWIMIIILIFISTKILIKMVTTRRMMSVSF